MSNHAPPGIPLNPPPTNAAPKPTTKSHEYFRHFAAWTATTAGSPWTFIAATAFLLLWACSYPLFTAFSDPFNTWQLVINTVTTIVTFLMVFLIQNTQNRDAKAIHLKLDELIRAHSGARNRLVDLQNCTDEELEFLRKEFERIRERATGQPHEHNGRAVATREVDQQNRASGA